MGEWMHYEREDFLFENHACIIVFPQKMREDRRWVWRAEFFGAFPSVDLEMLRRGYPVAYVCLSNRYGCPSAVQDMESFRAMLCKKYALNDQAIIFGFSRGGLYAVNYALRYPQHTRSLYLDAPVLDMRSWPGGKGIGIGAETEWQECLSVYGLREEEKDLLDEPLDHTEELAALNIPVVLVAGGGDRVVPYCENGQLFAKRFQQANGKIKVIVKTECDHHPHSLDDPTPIADYLSQS